MPDTPNRRTLLADAIRKAGGNAFLAADFVLALDAKPESRELLVTRDGDDEITEIRCPWECGSQEFLLLDQSHVRENRLVLGEGGWVEVWEDRNGRDLHTIGHICAGCRKPVDLPADIDPVW